MPELDKRRRGELLMLTMAVGVLLGQVHADRSDRIVRQATDRRA